MAHNVYVIMASVVKYNKIISANVNFTFKISLILDFLNFSRASNVHNSWVSEWVIVVKHQCSNFAAISMQEQINFQWDDDEVPFVLDQQHAALRRKSQDWLAPNQNNVSVSEWGDMSIRRLLFQWASTIKRIQPNSWRDYIA